MDIFKLNRYFWDYAFNNPEKIKPNHCAVYYFALEHSNRLGWKEKFGFPTSMVLEATGIKSYSVYKKTFDELVSFGFFDVIEYSKNQYSSNIIALKENYKALDKALDKALTKHLSKQDESTCESTCESNDSIDKQLYQFTNLPIYKQTNGACEEIKIDDFINSEKKEKEKSSAQKEKEIQDLRHSDFFKNMCDYFSQTSEVLQMRAFGDLVRIYNSGKIEEFIIQTNAYMYYKKISLEKVHRFQNYVHEWSNEDWVNKLKNVHKSYGKSTFSTNR